MPPQQVLLGLLALAAAVLLAKEAAESVASNPGAFDPRSNAGLFLLAAAMALVNFLLWKKKPVLAVDFDEVCVGYVPTFLRFSNDVHGTDLTLSDFHSYSFWLVPKCGLADRQAATERVYDFHASPYFDEIEPLPGALEALRALSTKYSLHVVTSRQNDIEPQTREFCERVFPNIFDGLHFGNHFDRSQTAKRVTKPEMCERIGAVALIDDSVDYARQCAKSRIRCLLFGDYPWNRPPADEAELAAAGVERVAGWSGVLDALGVRTP